MSDIHSRRNRVRLWGIVACLVAVGLAYANHFQNGFHFDDSHAVVDNIYLRDPANLLRFFTDATTFSALPANQAYRPLIPASLAVDYWLGGGLRPAFFQASTFCWFLVQLLVMWRLYRTLLAHASAEAAEAAALFAIALYGLHPAIAETVNYVIQRADVYATLGVVAGLWVYIGWPERRRLALYLLPVVLANLAKPTALIFPPILLAYLLLFERATFQWKLLLPAALVCAGMGWLQVWMTPKHYTPAILSAHDYIVTQPYVSLRYFGTFFLPIHLTADSDLAPFRTVFAPEVLVGLAFVVGLVAAAYASGRRSTMRPIAFGLWWFLIALVPTAVFPLSEVENDHRMYLPFVGLALSVTAALMLVRGRMPRVIRVVAAGLMLAMCGWGTWQRNRVWHDDESLWRDVAAKSPRNGRGLMNYGLALMAKGRLAEAKSYFDRAAQFTPNYHVLEINQGIVNGALGRPTEAARHFQRALALAPNDAWPDYYYGRWLLGRGDAAASVPLLREAIRKNPALLEARHALMQAYAQQRDRADLEALVEETLRLVPGDAAAMAHRQVAAGLSFDLLAATETLARAKPTPENYLALSLAYHQAKRYTDCIKAARDALRLKPDYAEAYNNIAAGYEALGQWDQAIDAARAALRLKPDFALARNNLAYSEQQKRLGR